MPSFFPLSSLSSKPLLDLLDLFVVVAVEEEEVAAEEIGGNG